VSAAPRFGVIGTGSLGYHHARLGKAICGDAFAGFFESNPERAATVARELGIKAFPSISTLLDATDAVSIVVPTKAHFAVAHEAIAAGKHVLIEKPITATLEEADELLALAERTGVLVQIGHIERFNRAIRAAAPYIDGPLFLDSDRLAPFNPRGADVAVGLDRMIHDIDLLLSLVGSKVRDVSAAGIPVLTPSVDIANARITFENGAVATITASRVSRDRMRKLRIFQRNGYLSLDLGAGTGELFRMKAGLDLAALAKAAQPLEAFVERVALEAPEGEPLRLEIENFVHALRGVGTVKVTGQDGRDALAVALRIVRDIERALPGVAALRGGAPGA
jgi:predicted dehydrogenase